MDWIEWDQKVIIGQWPSKSTFGANKQILVKLLAIKYAYCIQGRKSINIFRLGNHVIVALLRNC